MTVTLRLGPWTLDCDEKATRAAYQRMEHGASEHCRCPCCVNYQTVRSKCFPATFGELLRSLGADPSRECSVRRVAPLTDRLSLYAGSFALIGNILDGPLADASGNSPVDVFETLEPGVFVALRQWEHPPAPWPAESCLRLRFLMFLPWDGKDPAPALNLARCKGPAARRGSR